MIDAVSQLEQWRLPTCAGTCAGAGEVNAICCSNVDLSGKHLSNIKITLGDGIVFARQCQRFVPAVVSDDGAQALKTG